MLEEKRIDETNVSRRDFFVKAGALTAGMAVAGGLLGSLAGEADADVAMLTQPFTFKKLDPEHCRKWALEGYKGKTTNASGATISGLSGCCAGAAYGLLKELWTNGSDPKWLTIDPLWFNFGGGGIGSWGTLCGALNGSLYIMQLAQTVSANMGIAANELISWYCRMPFPSPTLINGTGVHGSEKLFYGYDLNNPGTTASPSSLAVRKVTSVSGSPLCHVSVSTWINAVNKQNVDCDSVTGGVQRARVNVTNEKSDRCARLSGDVAAKAAVIMNNMLASRLTPLGKHTLETNFCLDCHNGGTSLSNNYTDNPNMANKNNEQGLMPCVECHDHEAAHDASMTDNTNCNTCHTY